MCVCVCVHNGGASEFAQNLIPDKSLGGVGSGAGFGRRRGQEAGAGHKA